MEMPRDITEPRNLRFIIEQLVAQFNNTGVVTLTPSATSTVVQNGKVNPNSVVVLQAQTASAATETATSYVVCASGRFTVFHSNSPASDRRYGYAIFGV